MDKNTVGVKNAVIQAQMNDRLISFLPLLSRMRKPDLDFIHSFRWMGRGFDSEVKVEIWFQDLKAVVMFTDTGVGTSITNAAEQVIEEVYHKKLFGFVKENCLFIETYDKYKDGVDIIIPVWNGETVADVGWAHLGKILK